MKYTRLLPILLLVLPVFLFFLPVFSGKLPVPADTIIGLYHPFRDLYARDYPNGIPYKNFLITDPVRQQYPWRKLSIEALADFSLPLWNPYSLAGTPLVGNLQSAPYYPFNIFLFILPFAYGWALTVMLQPLLAGIFMFLYLRHRKLHRLAAILGGLTFAFSGFMVSWLEWNTIGHTGLWLPLILVSIDHMLLDKKVRPFWIACLVFGLCASFFAGHLQTFFYSGIIVCLYFFLRWWMLGKDRLRLSIFIAVSIVCLLITFVQWMPTLQLISLSARNVDLSWKVDGWFIPWQHLIQFIAPDFFGNPTTLNYWGVWNYGEFVGYIGIFPLALASYAMLFRRDKKTYFYAGLTVVSLLFSLPTFLAKLPYTLNIPFLATAQPTRLLFVTCFSLAVLAACGFDYWLKKQKQFIAVIVLLGGIVLGLWAVVMIIPPSQFLLLPDQLVTAKRNIILPSVLVVAVACISILYIVVKHSRMRTVLLLLLYIITVFDLLRFANKFTPFTTPAYIFPSTKTLGFLQDNAGLYRVMATDARILPPNFNTMYHIQSVNGYDPLYLLHYGELIAASERGEANINPPFGFNRIITPQRYDSPVMDLLGVKYILSLTDITSPKLKKVFQEGQTRIYENQKVLPRAFFVTRTTNALTKDTSIQQLFSIQNVLHNTAIVSYGNPRAKINLNRDWGEGKATIIEYNANRVRVDVEVTGQQGFLILTDTYYPTWKAYIDGQEQEILLTNHALRGVIVPVGKHVITFSNSLL